MEVWFYMEIKRVWLNFDFTFAMRRFLLKLLCMCDNLLDVNIVNLTGYGCGILQVSQKSTGWRTTTTWCWLWPPCRCPQWSTRRSTWTTTVRVTCRRVNRHKWLTWEAKAKPNKGFYLFLASEAMKWSTLDSTLLYSLMCVTGFLSHGIRKFNLNRYCFEDLEHAWI